jgi:hypothetical protein
VSFGPVPFYSNENIEDAGCTEALVSEVFNRAPPLHVYRGGRVQGAPAACRERRSLGRLPHVLEACRPAPSVSNRNQNLATLHVNQRSSSRIPGKCVTLALSAINGELETVSMIKPWNFLLATQSLSLGDTCNQARIDFMDGYLPTHWSTVVSAWYSPGNSFTCPCTTRQFPKNRTVANLHSRGILGVQP